MSDRSTRALANDFGAYFGCEPIPTIDAIDVRPVMLNPRAWPPCKHCGGNVHCEHYDPDTSAGLWGEDEAA